MLVGVDHVKDWIGSRRGSAASASTSTTSQTIDPDAPVSEHQMRPYRVAKDKGVPRDDRLNGLILVICGLGLLWLIPAYFLKNKTPTSYEPPPSIPTTPSYSRKYSLSDSTPGQAVLGVMTLVVLLATFALLSPEKQTQKAAERAGNNKTQ